MGRGTEGSGGQAGLVESCRPSGGQAGLVESCRPSGGQAGLVESCRPMGLRCRINQNPGIKKQQCCSSVGKVTAGLAETNNSLPLNL